MLFLLILWCREWWLLLRHEWWKNLGNTFKNLHNFPLDLSGDLILKSGGQSWCSLHNTLNTPMMSSQNNCNFIIQLLKAIDALKGLSHSHWLGWPKRGSRPATDALHHCRSYGITRAAIAAVEYERTRLSLQESIHFPRTVTLALVGQSWSAEDFINAQLTHKSSVIMLSHFSEFL